MIWQSLGEVMCTCVQSSHPREGNLYSNEKEDQLKRKESFQDPKCLVYILMFRLHGAQANVSPPRESILGMALPPVSGAQTMRTSLIYGEKWLSFQVCMRQHDKDSKCMTGRRSTGWARGFYAPWPRTRGHGQGPDLSRAQRQGPWSSFF